MYISRVNEIACFVCAVDEIVAKNFQSQTRFDHVKVRWATVWFRGTFPPPFQTDRLLHSYENETALPNQEI